MKRLTFSLAAAALCLAVAFLCTRKALDILAVAPAAHAAPVQVPVVANHAHAAVSNIQPARNPDDSSAEPKSRLVQRMLDLLDEVKADGSDEDLRLIRQVLMDADEELHRSLGKAAQEKILKANEKPRAFQVIHPTRPQRPPGEADQTSASPTLPDTSAAPDR